MRLGLAGRKHSGKSTVAQYLIEQGWQQLAIADPIKQFALDVMELFADRMEIAGPVRDKIPRNRRQLEEHKEAIRPLLQWVGYDFPQAFLGISNIWVWRAIDRLDRYPHAANIVIDDFFCIFEAKQFNRTFVEKNCFLIGDNFFREISSGDKFQIVRGKKIMIDTEME